MKWLPRNDIVLIRVVKVERLPDQISFPDNSIQGKQFVVEAIGPAVKDLSPGDVVMMLGAPNVHYYEVPNSNDLLVIKQEHIVIVAVDLPVQRSEKEP